MNIIKKFVVNQILTYVVNKKEVKAMLSKVKDALSGRKTYLIAAAAILGVIVSWSNGSIGDVEAIKAVVEAILACTIRAGVAKGQ